MDAAPFLSRHIGPSDSDAAKMLGELGCSDLEQFIARVVPGPIRLKESIGSFNFSAPLTESLALSALEAIASKNKVFRSFIGLGYFGNITPPVIQRNILENPGWYTQYTPYQAEIAQGRLEALLNFQTMVCDLTGLPVANASLLDEATAAAEAMYMCFARAQGGAKTFIVSETCHPQTIAVVQTRAQALGVKVVVAAGREPELNKDIFGVLLQCPATDGVIFDYKKIIEKAHACGALVCVASDLLYLTLFTPPGELGADIAIGSAQRFGVPLGFGGPHAAFMACKDELKRIMPGRLIGVSKDSAGKAALRLSLQTREQHIRREKATSNICTAQVLLAVMASMYAVYHGPQGLRRIAKRVHFLTKALLKALASHGLKVTGENVFDTIKVELSAEQKLEVQKRAAYARLNFRQYGDGALGISLDETTDPKDVLAIVNVFTGKSESRIFEGTDGEPAKEFARSSKYLAHPVFNSFHSETEFLRYLKKLEARDLSLAFSMIPLGSCTMKLNATSEMLPVTWREFSLMHPFSPEDQTAGYRELFEELEEGLRKITGFDAVSLQPNAGSQGEYAGLLAIKNYLASMGQTNRNICLIPRSAHGTNPASAVVAGLQVVAVECDSQGNIDHADLEKRSAEHAANLACIMVTYPSTHGVFEEGIKAVCEIVHKHGGQVYMDGANLNAMVGVCRPADIGADLCHINLHKTFCIPHGGGGPGMGPIAVKEHLAPFLPTHPLVKIPTKPDPKHAVGPVSAAPWGSASILTISWMYMKMMGDAGMTHATKIAILNANYVAKRLETHYPVLYRGKNGFCAHECIIDCRPLKKSCGVEVEDIAKRLMDYGFHAPTVSFPVPGTIMIEPTESESKAELDRFCEAMISIRREIAEIEAGKIDRENNPLKNAPHTAQVVTSDNWSRPYSRELAAYPAPWTREHKFWPSVGRIDGAYGDKNLVCTCPEW